MYALVLNFSDDEPVIVERHEDSKYLTYLRRIQGDPTLYTVVPLSERAFIRDFGTLIPDGSYSELR